MCPGPNQDMVYFCTSQEGSWLGLGGYSILPHNIFGKCGKGNLFLGEGNGEESGQVFSGVRTHVWIICFFCTLIRIFAVTVWLFFISFVFPVNCSYFNQWFLPFVTPIPLITLLQGDREGRGDMSEPHVICSISVGTLNWAVPFLNHKDMLGKYPASRTRDSLPLCTACSMFGYWRQKRHLNSSILSLFIFLFSVWQYKCSCKTIEEVIFIEL